MSDNLKTPVNRTSLSEEIYSRLRAAVMSGEVGLSDSLTETGLADQLGTSRAPVREALTQLEQEGLLVSRGRHKGYGVPSVSRHDVEQIAQVRVALEKLAVSLFIQHAAEADYEALSDLVDRLADAVREGNYEVANEIDRRLHERICEGAEHELLLSMWTSMRAQLTLAMRTINLSFPSTDGLVERHRELLDVIRSGDVREAERAIEKHILSGLELVVNDDLDISAT